MAMQDATLPAGQGDPVGSALMALARSHARLVDEELWSRESDQAAVVARYLSCHPHVAWVRYPGLPGDPRFEEAARTLRRGFGPFLALGLAPGFSLPMLWEMATPHADIQRWENAVALAQDAGEGVPEGALALRLAAAADPLEPVRELEALLA